MALAAVLVASALLLILVGALVDLGTVRLQKTTEDLRAVQAVAGADAGVAWVRAILQQNRGDIGATLQRLGSMQSRRRFPIDDRSYAVTTVTIEQPTGQPVDHLDANLEQFPQATEQVVEVASSAALYVDAAPVTQRTTVTLLRVFPAPPFSEVAGVIDDGGPAGIYSPGDAAGQVAGPNATELLMNVASPAASATPTSLSQFGNDAWSDGNSSGPGALP